MLTRQNIAGFLQGFFVLPLCALFGGLIALLFRWQHVRLWLCISFCILFPLAGALKTRQRALLAGLLAGLAVTLLCTLFAQASPSRASDDTHSLHGFVICLDPGHTSETSAGTVSRDGRLTERHVNWVLAQRLRGLLHREGATVVMTKLSENEMVTNRRRAEIANATHANLLLRLHCDAAGTSGLATFYPDRQGTSQGRTGPPQSIIAASRRAAERFQPAVIAALAGALPDRGIHGDSQTAIGSRQGALTGSIFARVPAITVEVCVLTNDRDYHFIRTAVDQEKMAQALLAGVENYARGYIRER